MSYPYENEGYKNPVRVWTGVWNNEPVALFMWEAKPIPSTGSTHYKYAIDLRSLETDDTIEIAKEVREFFLSYVLYNLHKEEERVITVKKSRMEHVMETKDE